MALGLERLMVTVAPVSRVTLARSEKRNALDRQMLTELGRVVRLLDGDEDVRVVVVSGAGPDFSAGVDLKESAIIRDQGEPAFRDYVALGNAVMDAIDGMKPVTIAAVHGNCMGAGMVLAAACDLRIASITASFSMPETVLGFPVMWGGIPRLLRHMSLTIVRDAVLTGRPLDADEAYRVGLVNRVTTPESLEPTAEAWGADLAESPLPALLSAKRMIERASRGHLSADEELTEALAILFPDGGNPTGE